MSSLKVQTPPAQEPVALATLKSHLRVTISNDDSILEMYLQAAREQVESDSGCSLVNKLYRQSHDRFPGFDDSGMHGTGVGYMVEGPRYSHKHRYDERQEIKLLRSPLVNVQSIVYIGTDELSHTLLPAPAAWLPGNEYDEGDQVVDPNGNLQEVTAVSEAETGEASTSGLNTPSWNMTQGQTTTDRDLTWTNKGPAPAGDFIYDADSEPPRIRPVYGTFWPLTLRVPNAVQVFFTAGYGDDGASAPARLKVALCLVAGMSYEYRELVTPERLYENDNYNRLIWGERVLDYAPTR